MYLLLQIGATEMRKQDGDNEDDTINLLSDDGMPTIAQHS